MFFFNLYGFSKASKTELKVKLKKLRKFVICYNELSVESAN